MLSSLSRIGNVRIRPMVVLTILVSTVSFFFSLQQNSIGASTVVAGSFEGSHDGADCSQITGWAWNAADPNNAITVDIYSDNVFVTSAVANQFRQDLVDANKGNGFHGFDIATPASLMDGVSHSIRVTIGGSTQNLTNTPKTISCVGPSFDGFLDSADCNVISGWAWDSTQPNTPINVDVYFDNDNFRTISAPADKFRQDLQDAGKGNGFHGYFFPTPASLKDGLTHKIHVRFPGTLVDLHNSPLTINCSGNPPPAFDGFHDGASCNQQTGWAWDANRPNTVISVDIYSDNVLIATIPADQFRQDLLDAGKGNGFHAFFFDTPMSLKDGQTHTISIGFHGTDLALHNTFKTINCP